MTKRSLVLFSFVILFPLASRAEGQEGLVIILDTFRFVGVLTLWLLLFFIFLYLVKLIRKKANGITQKKIVGLICLLFGAFHFIMIKSDRYPYEGPIDEFIHRDQIKADKLRDSLLIWRGNKQH